VRHGWVVVREGAVWREEWREHEHEHGRVQELYIGQMRMGRRVERAVLLDSWVACWTAWEELAVYVPDGLEVLEGWNEVGEPRDRVLYDFGSKDERRVVLWMMNEL